MTSLSLVWKKNKLIPNHDQELIVTYSPWQNLAKRNTQHFQNRPFSPADQGGTAVLTSVFLLVLGQANSRHLI